MESESLLSGMEPLRKRSPDRPQQIHSQHGSFSTQFLPVISKQPGIHVTQFCRTPNWVLPPVRCMLIFPVIQLSTYYLQIRTRFSSLQKWLFTQIPLIMRLYRIILYIKVRFFRRCLLFSYLFIDRTLVSAYLPQ